jgi:glycosyltransferase involved in cell wall biosynthesis
MPKLSVIVPVYNTEKYLRECIDSILAQTFTDFELILVNDGSTDGSGAICDAYATQDERIRVIHQQNGGVTRARKCGVRNAVGMYFGFVDSDDWIHPEMYAQMIGKCVETGADIVVCDVYLEYGTKTEVIASLADEGIHNKTALHDKIYPAMVMNIHYRRPGIIGSSCNKLYRKTVLDKVFWQIDDTFVFAEDALFSYAAMLESESVYILHKNLYHYRQHLASATHQYYGFSRYQNLMHPYRAHLHFLKDRGFDVAEQINHFIAINSINNVRRVLLFDQKTPLYKRLSQARDFVSQPIIADALRETIKKLSDRKERLKMFLALHKCVGLLYFLFAAKQFRLDHAG